MQGVRVGVNFHMEDSDAEIDCNNKTKQCGGQCVTCAQRKFPFDNNYPTHVVVMSVKAAP